MGKKFSNIKGSTIISNSKVINSFNEEDTKYCRKKKSNSDIAKKAKALLAKSKIEECLDFLRANYSNLTKQASSTIIDFSNQYKSIQEKRKLNIITPTRREKEIENLVKGILEMIDHDIVNT